MATHAEGGVAAGGPGCTLIELSGLVLVAVIGAAFLFDGGGDAGRALEFKEGDGPLLLVISGASLAFYALIGFEDSVNVAEETRAAPRAFPGTLFLCLGRRPAGGRPRAVAAGAGRTGPPEEIDPAKLAG